MPEQNLQYDARHAVTVIYTAAVSKHRFVSWAGAHATDAAQVQGVSELAGATGKAGSVVTGYSYFVEAAAAIPAGSSVAPSSDGTGRAVVAAGTQCGRALTAAAAAGELVVVRIQLVAGGLLPESLVSTPWKNGLRGSPLRRFRPMLSLEDAALWDDRAGSGMTVAVDTSVLFDGRPTLRIDIPALSSGTYRVGTTTAACDMPTSWDGKGLTIALMTSNGTAVPNVGTVFLGDSTFTDYYSMAGLTNRGNVPQANWVDNEWMVGRFTTATDVGPGTATFTGAKRLRVSFNVTSNASATTLWLGFLGIVAPKKTTVVVSIDDGYRTGYDFVAPLARYYGIPVSFGIDRYYIQTGAALYMTESMIRELHADTSDLFEFVTHGYNNTNLTTAGSAAAYTQQQVETRAYLRSLGIAGDGPNHHPWVQSVYDNAAVAAMKAAGFLSARIGGAGTESNWDSHWCTLQDKQVFHQVACISPTTGLTVSDLQTNVTAAVTEGYGITHVNMHQAGAADAASPLTWTWAKWIDTFQWLDAQRTAGNIEIKCWGRAYADSVGVGYVK